MKFDEIEKVESESRPKDNIIVEKRGKARRGGGLNVAVGASIIGAGVAVVTLGTTLVSMAMNGVLMDVFKGLVG